MPPSSLHELAHASHVAWGLGNPSRRSGEDSGAGITCLADVDARLRLGAQVEKDGIMLPSGCLNACNLRCQPGILLLCA